MRKHNVKIRDRHNRKDAARMPKNPFNPKKGKNKQKEEVKNESA